MSGIDLLFQLFALLLGFSVAELCPLWVCADRQHLKSATANLPVP
jgi:hypothetical protein